MKRKIVIGETYKTKQGNLFTVNEVVKGKSILTSSGKHKGNKTRIAIDENGNRLRINNLLI